MITLSMIVRNESHCIERCLRSVSPFVHAALIVDTGSTDNTCSLISRTLVDVPHKIVHRPWVDFAHNRTEALELIRSHPQLGHSHALLIDADEEFQPDSGFQWPVLDRDVYCVWHQVNRTQRYVREFLVNMKKVWTYSGPVHECLNEVGDSPKTILDGCSVYDHFDSFRNSYQSKKQKYLNDAKLLLHDYYQQPSSRSAFYIAESYRWAGEFEIAMFWYKTRLEQKGCEQERWWSAFMLARCMAEMNHPHRAVLEAFARAHDMRPSRAETLVEVSRYLYKHGQEQSARTAIRQAMQLPMTTDTLNVSLECYSSYLREHHGIRC